jgi:hypothetical protein
LHQQSFAHPHRAWSVASRSRPISAAATYGPNRPQISRCVTYVPALSDLGDHAKTPSLSRRISDSDEVAGQLEPAAALEDDVEHDSEGSHREERDWVTQSPADLGHVLEVHAVDGAYQGRREEDGGPAEMRLTSSFWSRLVWVSRWISSFWR